MTREELLNHPDFILLSKPLNVQNQFEIIGGFPYSKACLYGSVKLPYGVARIVKGALYDYLRSTHPLRDNKVVIVCRDLVEFGTEDFALFIKDAFCSFGKWEEIRVY